MDKEFYKPRKKAYSFLTSAKRACIYEVQETSKPP